MGPTECNLVFKVIGYQLGTGTLIAEIILAVRTWVIWQRSGYIAITLATLLVAFWTPVFYFLAQALNSLIFKDAPDSTLPGCFLQSQKNILFVVFILISSFETIIMGLTLLKCWDHFYHTSKVSGRPSTSLARILYRDGIMNYIYLSILSIMNMIIPLAAPDAYSTTLSGLQNVMHSVLSGRVLLHLREAAVKRTQLGSTFDTLGKIGETGEPKFHRPNASFASALQTATWFGDTDDSSSQILSQGLERNCRNEPGHSGYVGGS
ncbi:hypothetical protein BDZ94DRAFT_1312017 [Collybia nuda]|uniref:Uncharacterized protein n=1 Tax=Collybia nuda TaxID=64659 RepID=A0A9P5XZE0_9AGAR|nr:hypothetical protein BDZ94DRAFT_1312017 [Collybia nuda]